VAEAANQEEYLAAISTIRRLDNEAATYIENIPAASYTEWAFPAARFGQLTSNIVESMNSALARIRELPIVNLIQNIQEYIMEKMVQRNQRCQGLPTPLLTYAMDIINENVNGSRRYEVRLSSQFLGAAFFKGESHIVNLEQRTCTCKWAQRYQLPCVHMCAMIVKIGDNPYNYASPFYSVTAYRECYRKNVIPIQYHLLEVDETFKPPATRRPRGRPKKKRIASRGEQSPKAQKCCSRCGGMGHNRRTCREPI
jgi:hypothetical protein